MQRSIGQTRTEVNCILPQSTVRIGHHLRWRNTSESTAQRHLAECAGNSRVPASVAQPSYAPLFQDDSFILCLTQLRIRNGKKILHPGLKCPCNIHAKLSIFKNKQIDIQVSMLSTNCGCLLSTRTFFKWMDFPAWILHGYFNPGSQLHYSGFTPEVTSKKSAFQARKCTSKMKLCYSRKSSQL